MKKRLRDRISDSLEIPREILTNVQKIIITGNGMVRIESIQGIEEYSSEKISVKVKDGICSVSGENLNIDEITDEFVLLKGRVKTVEFM